MDTDLVCAKDGVATRLRCARCETGICPACLVRTPVGYKCPACAGEGGVVARRRPVVPAMVAVGGLLVLAAGVVLARPGSSNRPPAAAPSTAAGATADAGTPTREPMMGEEARDGQLAFVVGDFSCAAPPPPDAGAPAAADKLCRLSFTVRNVGGSPAMFLGQFQYLVDAQARTYGADADLTRAVPENGNRSIAELNVNPGVSVPLVLVFDVPTSTDPTEAQFKGNGRSRFGINVRLAHRA